MNFARGVYYYFSHESSLNSDCSVVLHKGAGFCVFIIFLYEIQISVLDVLYEVKNK
jgi:hypothetical protein